MQAPSIRIPKLSNLERIELEKDLKPHGAVFHDDKLEGGRHGEIVTTMAVVAVSLAALRVLAVWLARTSERGSFKRMIEIAEPNGAIRRETIQIKTAKGQSAEEAVLKQLAQVCQVDVGAALPGVNPEVPHGN